MITSAANKNIREIIGLMKRASHRKASGCYVAEGIKMFEELPDKNIQKIYINERLHERLYWLLPTSIFSKERYEIICFLAIQWPVKRQ